MHYIHQLAAEIIIQDKAHPAGYPITRDGIRTGIASLEDEIKEVWEEWNIHKRHIESSNLQPMRAELMQVAGIAMRMIRAIDDC